MKCSTTFALAAAAAAAPFAQAFGAPNIEGMKLLYSDGFTGCAGCSPDLESWNIMTDINVNNEVQKYADTNANIQLSGGDSLQLVPWKDDAGKCTSGRIESKEVWEPKEGKKLQIQAEIRIGANAQKQGIWPAFWLLGGSVREGTEWPLCGELDIYEQVNGEMTAYGTVHCGESETGGPCNEPSGRAETTPIPDNEFHTWGITIDRTSGDWKTQTISWTLDGNSYHVLTGAGLIDTANPDSANAAKAAEDTWATLAHSPYFMILNVAVGGNWPGEPNASTEDGYGSMLEVSYVGVYESA